MFVSLRCSHVTTAAKGDVKIGAAPASEQSVFQASASRVDAAAVSSVAATAHAGPEPKSERPEVAELRALFASLEMLECLDACLAESVTVADLRALGKDELKELIPKMGPRGRLQRHFAEELKVRFPFG